MERLKYVNKDRQIRECKVEGCNLLTDKHGYCNNHAKHFYKQLKEGKEEKDMVFNPLMNVKDIVVCKEINCRLEARSKGLCKKHYYQQYMGVELEMKEEEDIYILKEKHIFNYDKLEECKVDGCDRQSVTRGHCQAHYMYRHHKLKKGMKEEEIKFKPVRLNKDMVVCKVEDCGWLGVSKGYCKRHYQEYLRKKPLKLKEGTDIYKLKEKPVGDSVENIKCKLSFCNENSHAEGYCKPHAMYKYLRVKKGIKEEDIVFKPVKRYKDLYVCKEINCNREGISKGLCREHYYALWRGKELILKEEKDVVILTKKLRDTKCKVDDCDTKHRAKGYCERHYTQYRKQLRENLVEDNMIFS